MEYSTAAKLAQVPTKGKSPRRITGAQAHKASAFILSDIHKIIVGRHGGSTYDDDWVYTYLEAALPHIIATRRSWGEAVRVWVLQHVPILAIVEGDDWIAEQASACANRGKARGRRRNEMDRVSKLLHVTAEQVEAFGLCSIQAASRTKKVRERERSEANTAAKKNARIANGATPHEQSAARLKPWVAEGISRTRYYEALKAKKLASTATCDLENEALDCFGYNITEGQNLDANEVPKNPILDDFGYNIPVEASEPVSGQIRVQHIFNRKTDPKDWTAILSTLTRNAEAARDAFALDDPVFAEIAADEGREGWRWAA